MIILYTPKDEKTDKPFTTYGGEIIWCTNRTLAETFASIRGIRTPKMNSITAYETLKEIEDVLYEERRKIALSKLSTEDRRVLGL
jgi:hypothetical protein